MTAVIPSPSVPAGTDRTQKRASDQRVRPARKPRTRTLKVWAVNLEVDETATHYLVYASPHLELRAKGISPHRARLRKCDCEHPHSLHRTKCSWCGGWHPHGVAAYLIKLLRSYPKTSVKVPALEPVKAPERQQMPESMAWNGRAWVPA